MHVVRALHSKKGSRAMAPGSGVLGDAAVVAYRCSRCLQPVSRVTILDNACLCDACLPALYAGAKSKEDGFVLGVVAGLAITLALLIVGFFVGWTLTL